MSEDEITSEAMAKAVARVLSSFSCPEILGARWMGDHQDLTDPKAVGVVAADGQFFKVRVVQW